MNGLEEKQVHILRVPVDHALRKDGVCLKHRPELGDCELQHSDFCERSRREGKFNVEIRCVVPGKEGSRAVEADDSAPAAFMVGKVNGAA